MINNFKNKTESGFTMIEMIITIFILSVAIIGVYTVFSAMNVLTAGATDKLIASYLSQEGIEIVRNIRDQNWVNQSILPDAKWTDGLVGANCTLGCQADYKTVGTDLSPLKPWGDNGDYLMLDYAGFYSYSDPTLGAKPTKFKRKITITCLPNAADCSDTHAIKVISEVFYDVKASVLKASHQESVKVEEVLYNWY